MSIKFSELTAATSLGANDVFPFVPAGGASAKKVTFSTLKSAIAPAKVYRASLTQGGDLSNQCGTYSFIVGHLYVLTQWGGDDFTNLGFVENSVPFIATGTTPNQWDGDSLSIFDLAPSSIVYENTLGFPPSLVRSSAGIFTIPEIVDDGKTVLRVSGPHGSSSFVSADFYFDESNGNVATLASRVLSAEPESGSITATNTDSLLKSTLIEVLRYP